MAQKEKFEEVDREKENLLETVIGRTQYQSHLEAREEEFWLCFKSDL